MPMPRGLHSFMQTYRMGSVCPSFHVSVSSFVEFLTIVLLIDLWTFWYLLVCLDDLHS